MTTLFSTTTERSVLRDYQEDAISGIIESFKTCRSSLLVMPTGTGKTVVFSELIRRISQSRAIVVAHREELIFQAAHHIENAIGDEVSIEQGINWSNEYSPQRVVVSTIQSLTSRMRDGRLRIERFCPYDFDLLIVDEAHHSTAKTSRAVIGHFSKNDKLRVLGVTATPDRADEEALGQIYESAAFEYGLLDAIQDGWLVPIRQRFVTIESINLERVGSVRGDLNQEDLAQEMMAHDALYGVASVCRDIGDKRRTLIFVVSVDHAKSLSDLLNSYEEGCSCWVCGKTDSQERRRIFRDYRAGKYKYLVNVGVATEGFDDPGISVVACARPTCSRALYAQMIGRGTRPLPGILNGIADKESRRDAIAASEKPCVEVIDFVGNSGKHKLICTSNVLGGTISDEVEELATRKIRESSARGQAKDTIEAIREAEHEVEERRRSAVIAVARYSSRWIDPFDALDMAPSRERAWHRGKPLTPKMRECLIRNRVNPDTLNYADAMRIIRAIHDRADQWPCTPGQAKVLNRFGYDTSRMSKARASELIDQLAKNNWRRV